jgi:ribosomal protein S18 acetylase RimI-like enzyme
VVEPLELEFRQLNHDDLPLVVQLQRDVMPNPWTVDDFAGSLKAGHLCLLAIVRGRPSACAVARVVAGEAELLTVATARHHQRAGIARDLLLEMFKRLAHGEVCECFLEVMVGNAPAIALYTQLGFETVGRRPGYYGLPEGRVDAKVMRLALNQHKPVFT